MIEKLKQLNVDRLLDMDEAVALSAYARQLENEYEALGMATPEWLERASNTLREEIARRTKAADLATLKSLEAEIEGYRTIGEKKADAQKRIADLQKRLGLAPATTGRK